MIQKLIKLAVALKLRRNIKTANRINALIIGELNPIRRNLDYGEGVFMNMNKYKSIGEYLKERRKKRLKNLSHF